MNGRFCGLVLKSIVVRGLERVMKLETDGMCASRRVSGRKIICT